jgi:GAF domain-containing protein
MLRRFLETSRRAEIVALLNAAHTETEIAGVAVHELAQTLEAEVVFLLAVDPREAVPVLLGQTGLDAAQSASVGGAPLLAAELERSRAQVHGRTELAGLDVRRLVVSPWRADSGRLILIAGARLYDEPFLPSEVALLEATTVNVGRALERAWLGAERDQHAAHQAALVRAAKALNASLVRDEVLQTLCEEISGALQADIVAVYFAHESGGLQTVAGSGVPRETLGGGQPEHAPGASVIRSGRAEILPPRDDDADVDLGLRGVTGVRCGPRGARAAPL